MFNITYENIRNITIVRFSGDLISDNIELLEHNFLLEDQVISDCIFDLRKLDMIDSTGLSYIINCLKKSIQNNTEIKLLHLYNQPKIIFEITRVDTLFRLYDNEVEALNSFINMEQKNESNHTNFQQTA